MVEVIVAATSDVHSPRYLLEFIAVLSRRREECRSVDLFLWAGDMVERGNVQALRPVLEAVRSSCPKARIVGVFGNEEYMDKEHKFMKMYPEVIWLNDTYMTFEKAGRKIAIYGTRGSLDEPTPWQRRHIPAIRRIYHERAVRLERVVRELKEKGYTVLTLMHYAPTRATLEGEDLKIWPYMASREMEKAILASKPDIVIHGHAHNSVKLEAQLDGIRVYNVAFPARRDILVIRL